MAVGDDMTEGSISIILEPVESNQSGGVLSPEDVAWADSCLIKDPEISDSNWNSLKDALLEILSSQPDSFDSYATGRKGSTGETGIQMLSSSEVTETSQNLEGTVDDIVTISGAAGMNMDHRLINENTETLWPRIYSENVFLPTYNEDLREVENSDYGVDLGFPAFVMEPSAEGIFKVWDLDIPAEEDELIKQLNKALAESSSQPIPSAPDDSGARKGLKDDSLDDLISGIADLSLNQYSA